MIEIDTNLNRNTKLIDIDSVSARLYYVCKVYGINTIGELFSTPDRFFYRIAGEATLREVEKIKSTIKLD